MYKTMFVISFCSRTIPFSFYFRSFGCYPGKPGEIAWCVWCGNFLCVGEVMEGVKGENIARKFNIVVVVYLSFSYLLGEKFPCWKFIHFFQHFSQNSADGKGKKQGTKLYPSMISC